MKGTHSFWNLINLCISNQGNLISIPNYAPKILFKVLSVLKSKGLIDTFQKSSSRENFYLFKSFTHVKIRLISTPSRIVRVT